MRALVTRLLSIVVASLALVGVLGVVGVASASAGECPNEQVRAESNVNPTTGEPYDMGLPECRAYEKVSPNDKAGYNANIRSDTAGIAAASGNGVTYSSTGAFAEPEAASGVLSSNVYRAVKNGSEWLTISEIMPLWMGKAGGASVGTGIVETPDSARTLHCGSRIASEGNERTEQGVFCAIHEPGGSWVVSPIFPVSWPFEREFGVLADMRTIGASLDFAHVLFILGGPGNGARLLSSDTEPEKEASGIYEVAGLGTGDPVTLRLVNVDNTGKEIGTTSPLLGNTIGGAIHGTETAPGSDFHAVSEDGETVYFEATPTGGVQTLYARIRAAYTVPISEPSAGDCAECRTSGPIQKPSVFQGASADGSKVFFTSEQELFAGHKTNNLYEYDFEAPVGQRVSLATGAVPTPEVQGVLRNSGDGSHVYFVAKGVLTSIPNSQGQEAQAGADNLYVYERDKAYPGGRTAFIAMLCSGHNASGSVEDSQCPGSAANDSPLWSTTRKEDITKNGDYVVFQTYAHLVPGDANEAPAVYRYDADNGELTWVSRPAPGFTGYKAEGLSSELLPAMEAQYGANPATENIGRTVSEDGSDVMFLTKERLQADDVNGDTDTYLWHAGSVSMISEGQEKEGLGSGRVSAMSASGADIFFITTKPLVSQDTDPYGDVYDARVDGGVPAPTTPPVECGLREAGEACQRGPASQPLLEVPGSATFTGGVNLSVPSSVPTTGSSGNTGTTHGALSRSKMLVVALKTCRRMPKRKRPACEARARKKYGRKAPAKKQKASSRPKVNTSKRRGK